MHVHDIAVEYVMVADGAELLGDLVPRRRRHIEDRIRVGHPCGLPCATRTASTSFAARSNASSVVRFGKRVLSTFKTLAIDDCHSP